MEKNQALIDLNTVDEVRTRMQAALDALCQAMDIAREKGFVVQYASAPNDVGKFKTTSTKVFKEL
jgi:hypothetical protein